MNHKEECLKLVRRMAFNGVKWIWAGIEKKLEEDLDRDWEATLWIAQYWWLMLGRPDGSVTQAGTPSSCQEAEAEKIEACAVRDLICGPPA